MYKLIPVLIALIIWFAYPIGFGGYCIGLVVAAVVFKIAYQRDLRRIQEDPSYVDYLLGDD